MLKKIIFSVLFFLCFIIRVPHVQAADYRSNYQVEYFLSEDNKGLNTRAQFSVQITNLRSDIYVNKFSLSFPKSFLIKDLKASDDNGEITPKLTVDETKTKIDVEFTQPNIGRDSINTFNLQFIQENLFQVNGNVWEVILPTIENREEGNYKIIVNLPPNTDKKISIAKPKPTLINGNQIIWDNPTSRTVYAIFGDSQLYELRLAYHLSNPNLYPVYTDIAFPPDTLHQKIFVQSINPKPSLVYTDEDGNYMGRYFLGPKETTPVTFLGSTEITVKARDEIIPAMRNSLAKQKNYLLTDRKYWQVSSVPASLESAYSIYRNVVNTLKYDYNKPLNKGTRLGASGVLKSPTNAVCVEFSDLFIGYAREKGIYSREIEGFGFSKDPQLRPLSLVSDVLHSWPEFYDKASELWIQIDPTWENTSGIDYYNSFDLNHIAFVIHGKDSELPLPAGMYKTENSRDVSVVVTTLKPAETKKMDVSIDGFPASVTDNKELKTKIYFTNNGNVYLWNIRAKIDSDVLVFPSNQYTIPMLAPYEKKEINVSYVSKYKNKKVDGSVTVTALNNQKFSKAITVIPYTYKLALKISTGIVFLFTIMILLKIYRSHKR